MTAATLCEAFQRTAAIDPDAIAVRTVGGTQTLTWRDYAQQVRQVAAGLAGLGVGRGDSVAPYAAAHGLSAATPAALADDPGVIAQIAAGVAEGNAKLSRVEQIKRFRVLPALWEPGGDEVTLTMKLKRRPIAEKYAEEIEGLYAHDPGPQVHQPRSAEDAAAAL